MEIARDQRTLPSLFDLLPAPSAEASKSEPGSSSSDNFASLFAATSAATTSNKPTDKPNDKPREDRRDTREPPSTKSRENEPPRSNEPPVDRARPAAEQRSENRTVEKAPVANDNPQDVAQAEEQSTEQTTGAATDKKPSEPTNAAGKKKSDTKAKATVKEHTVQATVDVTGVTVRCDAKPTNDTDPQAANAPATAESANTEEGDGKQNDAEVKPIAVDATLVAPDLVAAQAPTVVGPAVAPKPVTSTNVVAKDVEETELAVESVDPLPGETAKAKPQTPANEPVIVATSGKQPTEIVVTAAPIVVETKDDSRKPADKSEAKNNVLFADILNRGAENTANSSIPAATVVGPEAQALPIPSGDAQNQTDDENDSTGNAPVAVNNIVTPHASPEASANTNNSIASPTPAPPKDLPKNSNTSGNSADANKVSGPSGAGHRSPGLLRNEALQKGSETTETREIDPARFLPRVVRAFQTAQQGDGEVRIRLHPPELGSLRIEIQVNDGVMHAKLQAETSEARTVLLDNLPQLKERLAEQGIRVEQFDVDLFNNAGGQSQQFTDQAPRELFAPQRTNTRNSNRPTAETPVEPQRNSTTIDKQRINIVI